MGISLAVFAPAVFAVLFLFRQENFKAVKSLTIIAATLSALFAVGSCFIHFGERFHLLSFPFGIEISFKVDETAFFFTVVLTAVWYIISIFSFEYMEHERDLRRFYGFYILSYCGILGLCLADNLVTFYMFFEVMTFAGYFLIVHSRKEEIFMAGKKYLYYSLFGTGLSLISIFYLYSLSSATNFIAGGINSLGASGNEMEVIILAAIAVVGFCTKAGLFPLHAWLATAHPVAPAPASALLSAVMTKAGVLAALRILYFIIPTEIIFGTAIQSLLIVFSIITIFLGSTVAMFERHIKKRLAYSSVSQISYALFSLFLLNEFGLYGMFLQVLFHAFAKALLFMNSGVFINKLKSYYITEVDGIMKQLKLPIITFAIASLSLVGIPFTGGFVAKWQIALGALNLNRPIALLGVVVIMLSAIMTAGYLFPIVIKAVYNKNDRDIEAIQLDATTKLPLIISALVILLVGSFYLFFGTEILSRLVNSVLG